jgi:Tol biopolymer transport system component
MNADGSGQRRLAHSAESCDQEFDPAWSPDGREIAIVSNKIYVMTPTAVDSGN